MHREWKKKLQLGCGFLFSAGIQAAEKLKLHASALCLILKHGEERVLICKPSPKPRMFNFC